MSPVLVFIVYVTVYIDGGVCSAARDRERERERERKKSVVSVVWKVVVPLQWRKGIGKKKRRSTEVKSEQTVE